LRHVKNPYNYRGCRNCKLNSLDHFSPIALSLPEVSRDICARLAETSETLQQSGSISLWVAVPTVGILTGPTLQEEEEEEEVVYISLFLFQAYSSVVLPLFNSD
jgi:hypothetical protein